MTAMPNHFGGPRAMEILAIPVEIWAAALAVCFVAGIVKGMVGFAMPMIMISGVSSFAAPELALAALILPTVATNVVLVLRGGLREAFETIRPFTAFIVVMLICLTISAQIVPHLPGRVLLLAIGVPVTLLSLAQLSGWRPAVAQKARRPVELVVGAFAGIIGGIGGVWGPPTVLYLTAIGTPKTHQLRAQGAIYGTGSLVLLASHIRSGILNETTAWFSAAMLAPALLGMFLGFVLHDRMDQDRFRSVTLAVLTIAGLNLVRRGVLG